MYWAVTSPNLMGYPFSTQYIRDKNHAGCVLDILKMLDSDSDIVDDHFNSLGHLPMGKYFEQLLFFMVDKDHRFELLLSNHQIIQENRTIGGLRDKELNELTVFP